MGFTPRALRPILVAVFYAAAAWVAVGPSVALAGRDAEAKDYPVVFREMGVVQNKAMNKQGRLLFVPSFAMDFSDGPYSMYSVGARIGYAVSDFLEIYGVANPKFISQMRPFIQNLKDQVAANNYDVDITGAIARSEYGLQLLWAPLYGKDSFGVSRIVRSDTFLRLGVSQIKYDIGSGLKIGLGAGKTFFINSFLGFRVLVEEGMTQTINQGLKKFGPITYVESGVVVYY